MTENLDQVVSNLRAGCDYRLENGKLSEIYGRESLDSPDFDVDGFVEWTRRKWEERMAIRRRKTEI